MGNVASMAGWGFQIAEHASSKTWLFGLQARKAVGVRALKLNAVDGSKPGEEERKVEMRKTQRLDYTGDGVRNLPVTKWIGRS